MSNNTNETDVFDKETSEQSERRRTIWIWIILASEVWSLFLLIPMWKRILAPLTDIELQQVIQAEQSLGIDIPHVQPDIGIGVLTTVGEVIAVLAMWELFMLRSRAIKLFAISFGIMPVMIVYQVIMTPNYLSYLKTPMGWTSVLFAFVINIAIILYAVRLRRRGVLL